MSRLLAVAAVGLLALVGVACGGDDDDGGADGGDDDGGGGDVDAGDGFVADIRPAIDAIEAEIGAGQEFFEITASRQVINLFVAVDDATAALPYVFLDGELQPPAPKVTGASGFTFAGDAIVFDEVSILDAVSSELPDSTIEALSIEGGDGGIVRYVVATLSPGGGRLDVTVSPEGAVLEVDPVS